MLYKDCLAIYGVGGYAREVMPLVREEDSCYIIDQEYRTSERVNSKDVVITEEFFSNGGNKVAVAVGDPLTRKRLVEKCQSMNENVTFPNIIADNVVIMSDNFLSEGMILSPFFTITSNCTIGKHFHGNLYSYIGHDCIIGDFVTFSPGVKCSGYVNIGDNVFVGTGAIIRPGTQKKPLKIGSNVIIGMGSVITKDIPDGATVFGNPATIIKRG